MGGQPPGGASLAGVAQSKEGREEMVSTFSGNQFQLHNGLLRHDPTQPGSMTPPGATTSPGATPSTAGTAPAGGKKPAVTEGSTARPPFSCKVTRAKKLTLACTLRGTAGKPKPARIRAVRGKKVLGPASGRVRDGNRLPILRMKRITRRVDTRITITVKLANGKPAS